MNVNNPIIIMFNGPPRSGKDTAADIVSKVFASGRTPVVQEKMSAPLKRMICVGFDMKLDELERYKDTSDQKLFGLTGREAQISLSEDWAKKVFNKELFGRLLLRRIVDMLDRMSQMESNDIDIGEITPIVTVSDCGFTDELAAFNKDPWLNRTLVLRLHRKGYDFETANDSREYVLVTGGVQIVDVHADDLKTLSRHVVTHVSEFVDNRVR